MNKARILTLARRLGLYLLVAFFGFVAGVTALYVYRVRRGPGLEIWHTEVLSAEFSARRSQEVRSFEDYLELEDELFSEMEQRVYAHVETGEASALMRYSAGSTADPRRWPRNWNRSFELPSAEPLGGVLLLHGMSDSPYSLRSIGEALHQRGYWVVGLRLPGHGTLPSGLRRVRDEDMVAAVRLAMEHLAAKAGSPGVHVIGYSTGAPLALGFTLAALEGRAEPVPRSLVLVSPAIGITRAAALARWKDRLAALPGLERLAWNSIRPEFDPFKYNSFSTNAGAVVHRLTRGVTVEIERRAAGGTIDDFPPTLVFLSTVDATVSVDAVVDHLLEHLAPGIAELVLYDINRQKVAGSVLVSDPGPLTTRLMADETLPFALTLITNESPQSLGIERRSKAAGSSAVEAESLPVVWPRGVISLSHVALPFPPNDPLYGSHPESDQERIFLGQIDIRGERGLLRMPADWLMRLRYNPFYAYQEKRILDWLGQGSATAR